MRRWLSVILLALALPAAAQTERFYGYAYDLKTDRHLYTEVHEQHFQDGRWTGGRIAYYLPDGRRLGLKTLDFAKDAFVPVFRLDLELEGYMEAIVDNGDPIVMERREGAKAKVERKSVKRDGPTAADSGFHAILYENFERLMKGETVSLRLAVAGGLDQYRFRGRRVGDSTFEDRPAVRFVVEPDSLLRFVVDPLDLTYDPKTRQLLEYRGLSNIRNPATGQLWTTRIAYYSKPPAGIGQLPPLEF